MASANEIPAGGEGQITVTVHAGTRSGPLRQAVQVATNAPGQEATILTVTAQIVVDLEAVPALLRFEDKQLTAQVGLRNSTTTPVELGEIRSPSEFVKITTSATIVPAQGEVIVTAELSPDAPTGVISGWAEIQSNLKTMPVVQIRVWANIQK